MRFAHLTLIVSLLFLAATATLAQEADTPITPENAADLRELATLGRGLVYDLVWTPDGDTLRASAQTGVWDYPIAPDVALPDAPTRPRDAAYDPATLSDDGAWLASGGETGAIRLEHQRDNITLDLKGTGVFYMRSLAFSADNRVFAAVSSLNVVYLWRLPDGEALGEIPLADRSYTLALNADGSLLATVETRRNEETFASYDAIRLWDTASGEAVDELTDETMWLVSGLRFSPDDRQLAAAAVNAVYLWDVEARTLMHRLPTPPLMPADETTGEPAVVNNAVTFSPDGAKIAAIGADQSGRMDDVPPNTMENTVYVWDVTTGGLLALPPVESPPMFGFAGDVAFNPAGDTLAYYAYDGTIRLWNVDSGEAARPLVHDHYGSAGDVLAISPDGERLFGGGFDRMVRVWSLSANRVEQTVPLNSSALTALAVSPDGQLTASASDLETTLWAEDETLVSHHFGGALALAFSPDGALLYTVDATTGDLFLGYKSTQGDADLTQESFEVGGAMAAAFDRSVELVAIGTSNGTVEIRDAQTFEVLHSFTVEGLVSALEFVPGDSSLLVVAQADGVITLRDMTGEVLATFENGRGEVKDLAFSPDGELLAAAVGDRTVRVWEAAGEGAVAPLATLEGHLDEVRSVVFSPDGARLFSGSWDTTVKVWGIAE